MTTPEAAYAQLAALERMSVEARESGSKPPDYFEMARLRAVVQIEERKRAKARETSK